MRLIDADALKKAFYNQECWSVVIEHIIDNAPTVERPTGKWEEKNDRYGYFCSVCGELLPCSEEYDFQTNFCPNCGADMRGD